ncbi:helix-turn-helix domain-containing protein [Pedobacter miscanthi]|nr:helix-turn-helix domain-containing protein [Pedobacter miscanthi]
MQASKGKIPVNIMDDALRHGIAMDTNSIKTTDFPSAIQRQQATQSHRDEGYTFHILERGKVVVDIDFQTYHVSSPAVVFLRPDQVHRMREIDHIIVSSISIDSEKLNVAYHKILEDLTPATPLSLSENAFSLISEYFSVCLKLYRKKAEKMYHHLVRESCNALVGLLVSEFLNQKSGEETVSRFDKVAKFFRKSLERNYCTLKRPGEYAALLNISTPYLNECLKNATGFSASQLIHDRIILEAKRLLYHTDKSVKEIAFDLGYADYPYFSRLFSKSTGTTAIAFRNQNLD